MQAIYVLLRAHLCHNEPHLHYVTKILCAATDVGMHGLLASQSCYRFCVTPSLVYIVDSSRFLQLLSRHPYILLTSYCTLFSLDCMYPFSRQFGSKYTIC